MKAWWQKIAVRFDALQRRERSLVALAVLLGLLLIGYALLIDPAWQRGQDAERRTIASRARLAELDAQLAVLNGPERQPDAAAQTELKALRAQLGDLNARLRSLESALVPPDKMAVLLEEMIGTRSGLRLLSLKNLPARPFPEKRPEETKEVVPAVGVGAGTGIGAVAGTAGRMSAGGLYRHSVEIRLEGSYQDLVVYLERLEKSSLKILWSDVALSATHYPRLVLTLTVYSLSLDRAWLIV